MTTVTRRRAAPRPLVRTGRGVALAARSPAAAPMLARMLFWRAVLPALRRVLPLPTLVSLMAAPPSATVRDPEHEARIASLADRAFGREADGATNRCLDLSLVTFRVLGRANADPTLVIAVSKSGERRGHAWVTVDGEPVHDSPERLDGFVAVASFASDGSLRQEGTDNSER